jgi:hypothetical protein
MNVISIGLLTFSRVEVVMNRTSLLLALIVPSLLGACGAGENTVGTDWPDAGKPSDTSNPSDSCNNCTPEGAKLVLSTPEACLTARQGERTESQTFEISNPGTAASGALTASLNGNDAPSFVISSNTCTGSTLAPGARCSVVVAYDPPTVPTRAESANLIVTDGATSVQALIRGSDGTVTASPAALSFGTVAAGIPSDELFVRVTTTCKTTWFAAIDNPNFVISTNTCTGVVSTCQIGMRFAPPQGPNPSSSAGFLTVTASDSNSVNVALTGIISPIHPTPAPLTASVALLDLGEVKVGESRTGTITVDGAKATPTAVISGSPLFAIAANTCKAAGETCTLQVQFAPTATGAYSATLNISDGQTMVTVALTGQGLAAPAPAPFTATPTALDFGQVQITFTSTPLMFTVSTPIARSFKMTLSDSAASEMAIVQDTCTGSLLIPAGGTCAIGLIYKPTKTGNFKGTVDISDGTDVVSVHLTGVGWTLL